MVKRRHRKRGKHVSCDKSIKHSIKWLENLSGVKRVILGRYEVCRHSFPPGNLKVQNKHDQGIKVKAYAGNGVTDMHVIIEPLEQRDEVVQKIAKRFY